MTTSKEIQMKSFGKSSHEIAKKLQTYFNAVIIGSVLFVDAEYLSYEDINDIDVLVDNFRTADKIRSYLVDEGWKETKSPNDTPNYARVEGSLIFQKDLHVNIHVSYYKDEVPKAWSLGEMVQHKFFKSKEKDKEQLEKIVSSMKIK